jgi:predicted acylesterase/phospholipase RssA
MAQVAKDKVEIGVVLQGGGALGAYEYGAMTALLELMDKIDVPGRTVRLVAVTGVSIGAINAACVVGAKDRTDARRRLESLRSDLSLDVPDYWWTAISRNLALLGVPGFYSPRRDIWNVFNWTNFYDTDPMLGTLAKHVDFISLNASETSFVVTAVDVASGELIRFRNHARGNEPKVEIGPRHVLASGSLPPAFPSIPIKDGNFWDGGVIDNTPLGDAIEAFSASGDVDRFLVVMNLFRKQRAAPKNMIEVNDRLSELRYGNRLRQDRANANTINQLVQTIDALAAAVPAGSLDQELEKRVQDTSRFKILNEITDIDLADPGLMAKANLSLESSDPAAFRDFSAAGVERRRRVGYQLAQLKLRDLFEAYGLLPAPH